MRINETNAAQKEFTRYLNRLADDERILPIHLSLIMALLYYHTGDKFADCFHASRLKLMRFSGVRAIGTYHKYLSELVGYGYIEYRPSWHPTKASSFKFIPL
jgi:hypothetical protein